MRAEPLNLGSQDNEHPVAASIHIRQSTRRLRPDFASRGLFVPRCALGTLALASLLTCLFAEEVTEGARALLVTQQDATGGDAAGLWLEVPYIKQTEEGCGSASLAMVLRYWKAHGAEVAAGRDDVDAIQKQLYSRRAHGIFASDMDRYLKQSGFRAFAFRGEWRDLREHLAQGRPVIVSLQVGSAKQPLHYVVVTGMDWQRAAVFVNDPARGKLLRIEREEFEKQWAGVKNWTLLAVPAAAG